jgi:hypothetical protein
MAMGEPLRHALHLVRAAEIAHRPGDDEMDALNFVAGEAFLRLEFVQSELNAIYAALNGDYGDDPGTVREFHDWMG